MQLWKLPCLTPCGSEYHISRSIRRRMNIHQSGVLPRKLPHLVGSSVEVPYWVTCFHLSNMSRTGWPGCIQGDSPQEWKYSELPVPTGAAYAHDSVKSPLLFFCAVFLVLALCFDNQTLSCPGWLLIVITTDSRPDVSGRSPVSEREDKARDPWLPRHHMKPQVRGLEQLPVQNMMMLLSVLMSHHLSPLSY